MEANSRQGAAYQTNTPNLSRNKTVRTIPLLLALCVALPAMTQEESTADAERKAAERNADRSLRWMGQLNLSETQKERIKKLLVENEIKKWGMDDAQSKKVRELLTPEQQETYDQWVSALRRARTGGGGWGGMRRGGRRGGGEGGGMRGMRMGGMGGLDQLRELNLTEDQQKKVRAIYEKSQGFWTKAWERMQGGEQVDWMAEIKKYRKQTNAEVEKVLTDEQKKKFAELNKQWDGMIEQWGGRMGNWGGRRGGQRGGTRPMTSAPAGPGARAAQLTDAAVAALKCSDEEEAVFRPLIKKLVDYKVKGAARLADDGKAVTKLAASGGDEETLASKVAALQTARAEYDAKLKLLESGVRELLTKRQEYALIGLEVLR